METILLPTNLTILVLSIIAFVSSTLMILFRRKLNQQKTLMERYDLDNAYHTEVRQQLDASQRQFNLLTIKYEKLDKENRALFKKNAELMETVTRNATPTGVDTISGRQIAQLQAENTRLKDDITLLKFNRNAALSTENPELKLAYEKIEELEKKNLALETQPNQNKTLQEQMIAMKNQFQTQYKTLSLKLQQSETNNEKLKLLATQQAAKITQFQKES